MYMWTVEWSVLHLLPEIHGDIVSRVKVFVLKP